MSNRKSCPNPCADNVLLRNLSKSKSAEDILFYRKHFSGTSGPVRNLSLISEHREPLHASVDLDSPSYDISAPPCFSGVNTLNPPICSQSTLSTKHSLDPVKPIPDTPVPTSQPRSDFHRDNTQTQHQHTYSATSDTTTPYYTPAASGEPLHLRLVPTLNTIFNSPSNDTVTTDPATYIEKPVCSTSYPPIRSDTQASIISPPQAEPSPPPTECTPPKQCLNDPYSRKAHKTMTQHSDKVLHTVPVQNNLIFATKANTAHINTSNAYQPPILRSDSGKNKRQLNDDLQQSSPASKKPQYKNTSPGPQITTSFFRQVVSNNTSTTMPSSDSDASQSSHAKSTDDSVTELQQSNTRTSKISTHLTQPYKSRPIHSPTEQILINPTNSEQTSLTTESMYTPKEILKQNQTDSQTHVHTIIEQPTSSPPAKTQTQPTTQPACSPDETSRFENVGQEISQETQLDAIDEHRRLPNSNSSTKAYKPQTGKPVRLFIETQSLQARKLNTAHIINLLHQCDASKNITSIIKSRDGTGFILTLYSDTVAQRIMAFPFTNILQHANIRFTKKPNTLAQLIIERIDTSHTEQDIRDELKKTYNIEINNVYRLTGKHSSHPDRRYPISAVKIAFEKRHLHLFVSGITLFRQKHTTRTPTPRPSVAMCQKCFDMTHPTSQCSLDRPLCPNCNQMHDDGLCNKPPSCIHCSKNHASNYKLCPVYRTAFSEQRIIQNNLRSFAQVTKANIPPQTHKRSILGSAPADSIQLADETSANTQPRSSSPHRSTFLPSERYSSLETDRQQSLPSISVSNIPAQMTPYCEPAQAQQRELSTQQHQQLAYFVNATDEIVSNLAKLPLPLQIQYIITVSTQIQQFLSTTLRQIYEHTPPQYKCL